MSSQFIYLTKTTECDKIEKLVTLKGEVEKKSGLRMSSQIVYLTKVLRCDIM